jgi:hypothetical protein
MDILTNIAHSAAFGRGDQAVESGVHQVQDSITKR